MYDTIIIGRDLSSLIAALTSVREGLKTVLVMEGDAEMAYRENGYTFPFDPRPLWGFVNRQIFSRFVNNAEVSDYDFTQNELMDPSFQMVLPDHRVNLFKDQDLLIAELIREYPSQARTIKRFYRNIIKTARLIDRWIDEDENDHPGLISSVIRQFKRLPYMLASKLALIILTNTMDKSLRRILDAQLAYLSHLEIQNDPLSLSAAYLLLLPIRGLFYPRGGIMSWMDHLRLVFQQYGGVLKDGYSVIRIETDPMVKVDLEKEGDSSTLSGKKLIVSSQWEKLEILLSGRKILPATNRPFSSLRIVSYPFSLHMGVREEGLPESMAPYVVVLKNIHGPVITNDIVFLQTSLPGEIDRAPEGRRAITATVYLTESPLRLSDPELKNFATGIIDSLEDFLPFLRDNIDFLRVDQSICCSRRYQDILGRKYRLRRSPFFGMKTLTPRTRLQNVILTGSILRPGLGVEGEILAGLDAVYQLKQDLKIRA